MDKSEEMKITTVNMVDNLIDGFNKKSLSRSKRKGFLPWTKKVGRTESHESLDSTTNEDNQRI